MARWKRKKTVCAVLAAVLLFLLSGGGWAENAILDRESLFGSDSPAAEPVQPAPAQWNDPWAGADGGRSLDEAMRLFQGMQTMEETASFNAPTPAQASAYAIRWTVGQIPFTVYLNDVQIGNGTTVGSSGVKTIRIAVDPAAGSTVTGCRITYDSYGQNPGTGIYESIPGAYDLTSQGGPNYTHTVRGDLRSDVMITVQGSASYPITVAGVPVTGANCGDILDNGSAAVTYDPTSHTLSLRNASINGSIDIQTSFPVTLSLSGVNTVYGSPASGYGIRSSQSLQVSAFSSGASLTVSAPAAASSCAVLVTGGELKIGSGVNVAASSAGGSSLSAGVSAGNVEVSGSLQASSAGAAESAGIRCGSLTVKNAGSDNGGRVSAAVQQNGAGSSAAISASGSIAVEYRAFLTAASQGAAGKSCGVWAAGGFRNDGTADCTAGNGNESTALYTSGVLTSSGTLTARSGNAAAGQSNAIMAGSLSITGGTVDARAGSGGSGARGILSSSVAISGGTVTAEGPSGALSAVPIYSGYTPVVSVSDLTSDPYEADAASPQSYMKRYVMIRPKLLTVSPANVTIRRGETYQLSCTAAPGYSVRWTSSNGNVSADEVTGRITGMAPGSAIVTAKAYNSLNAESGSAVCIVTVTEGSPQQTSPPFQAEAAGVHFDQETVTFHTAGGMRTVKYWVTPSAAADTNLLWTCSDTAQNILKMELSKENHEFTVIARGNGTALITATTPNGKEASCRVTVSDVKVDSGEGQTVSCYIDYMDNGGTWYYDWSDGFRFTCTGPVSALQGVYIDHTPIPEVSGGIRNWSRAALTGKTDITFSRAFMSGLARSRHTLSLSYSGGGTTSRTIYIQSLRDAPRTGDEPLMPPLAAFFLSGAGIGILQVIKRRKGNGI